jgi:hypothetical protein
MYNVKQCCMYTTSRHDTRLKRSASCSPVAKPRYVFNAAAASVSSPPATGFVTFFCHPAANGMSH